MANEPNLISDLTAGKTKIMGVVNVTPDSFSDGGYFYDPEAAIQHGLKLIRAGADVLDVGGESSRPGAEVVEVEEEIRRVIPVIEGLKKEGAKCISIDTRNAKTMEEALKAGVDIINDISGLRHDSRSVGVAVEANVPVILMHMLGNPQTMQNNPIYNSVVEDVFEYFKSRISYCETHRLAVQNLIFDPGIGFGKTIKDNLLIIRNIREFLGLGAPVLLGTSRKSFIAKLSKGEDANQRLGGSLSSVLWGLSQGVKFFRVHDVAETVQAIKIYEAILSANPES